MFADEAPAYTFIFWVKSMLLTSLTAQMANSGQGESEASKGVMSRQGWTRVGEFQHEHFSTDWGKEWFWCILMPSEEKKKTT